MKHLFDESDWNVYKCDVLNLSVGTPGSDLLEQCCENFKIASVHRMNLEKNKNNAYLFQYGPTPGIEEARNAIATFCTDKYQSEVKSDDMIITSGATQGLHFVLTTLVDLNGVVFIDEVTYMIALDAIKQIDTLQIIPIPLTDEGVDLSRFECILEEKKFKPKNKEFWGIYYSIPVYHNPTGLLFSEAVCEGLVKLARKYDFLICCDDVYNILNYCGNAPPKRLYAYDKNTDPDFRGNVISNCSFSKILGPGLRLGWIETSPRIRTILLKSGVIRSGGCFNNYTSGILTSLFELGLAQTQISCWKEIYNERMVATCAIFQKHLPVGCSIKSPGGGYFIWISLPINTDASDFLQFCKREEKIIFIPASAFSLDGKAKKNCFRISIGFHSTERLIDGASRICSAITRFLKL
ncbi:uncharacterized protein YER152C [Teleopsis dalmanni]|uniref:uncharacterized protein YER152C n=1 Tax=Teleopsis dalmanni TaxID=139649 RepID=UPI0018CF6540|nr:uncharacterized protein YER152C [Teleopsis dalmanni]XP_037936446.1 uncharacterized protein YER152C [Teleopsis dalmanni]XP_037936452.1 uncharacterized protein YER152C [Teleopsis dalmanni]XP_037936460.1 uncharacterized protein YER152C [Teleopsis dalmanni]